MQKSIYYSIILLLLALTPAAHSSCYTIYRNDAVIYQSSFAPVDMSLPLSQAVSGAFGENAFMIFQEWSNSCEPFAAEQGSSSEGSATKRQFIQNRTASSEKTRVTTIVQRPQAQTQPLQTSYFANEHYGNIGTSSPDLASSRTIYTGPRGGQYYINSNGNKSYVSGRSSSRSR